MSTGGLKSGKMEAESSSSSIHARRLQLLVRESDVSKGICFFLCGEDGVIGNPSKNVTCSVEAFRHPLFLTPPATQTPPLLSYPLYAFALDTLA